MYGLFQFRLRDFFVMTLFVVGGYAALIALLYFRRPGEMALQVEILQLIALFATFLQVSAFGSYIGRLRDKVKDKDKDKVKDKVKDKDKHKDKVKHKNKELESRNGELERALARIEELAMRDEPTGVFNRRYLMETIKTEKHCCERSGSVFSICILDVDHFKHVNDTFGHLAGDKVLQAIAAAASGALRQTD